MRSWLFIFTLLFASVKSFSLPDVAVEVMSEKLCALSQPTNTPKNKFIKKLVDSFKFKKNLQQKERKRVENIINDLLSKAPRKLTEEDLAALNKRLDSTEKIHYDEVLVIIKGLNLRIDSLQGKSSASDPDPDSKQGISDSDLDNLVNKLVPILTEKAEEEKAKEEQQKKLKKIRALLATGGSIKDTLILNDSVSKTYSLRLVRKAEVFGFNPYWVKERYLNYNFDLLSNLVFYGYELDYKTGSYIDLNGWDSSRVVSAARKAGCKVTLAIFISNTDDISKFLKNDIAQKKLVRTVASLLEGRHAKGAHITFENLAGSDRDRFVRFIRNFSRTLEEADSAYSLSISVPVIDENLAYKVKELDPYVDRFVIDFTKKNEKFPGPIAPLEGGINSMASGVSLYLNKNISPSKFIACIPYRGAIWSKYTKEFIDYINYNDIKSTCKGNPVVYDNSSTVRMDFINDGDTTEQLWYDDERTLAKKYDYILDNELGGAGIWALGYDDGYGELWSVLMEKFISVDTFDVKLVYSDPKKPELSFWDKVKREFHEYRLILADPCHERSSEFKSDDYIIYVTLSFLIILIVVGFIYIYNIRNKGDSWVWRKAVLRLLIFLVIMVIITTFLYFFLNRNIPLVGLSDKGCNPMPFSSLIIIISIGFVSGLLVMRFLIIPLIRRDDIP